VQSVLKAPHNIGNNKKKDTKETTEEKNKKKEKQCHSFTQARDAEEKSSSQ